MFDAPEDALGEGNVKLLAGDDVKAAVRAKEANTVGHAPLFAFCLRLGRVDQVQHGDFRAEHGQESGHASGVPADFEHTPATEFS